eukprot:gene12864-biopygen8895
MLPALSRLRIVVLHAALLAGGSDLSEDFADFSEASRTSSCGGAVSLTHGPLG